MITLHKIGLWVLVIAVFCGFSSAMGPEFMHGLSSFLFGGYVDFYHVHIRPNLPPLFHPVVIIILAALAAVLFPRFVEITQGIAVFVLALTIYSLAAWLLGVSGAGAPSGTLMASGVAALIWVLASGLAPSFGKLRDYIYGRVS